MIPPRQGGVTDPEADTRTDPRETGGVTLHRFRVIARVGRGRGAHVVELGIVEGADYLHAMQLAGKRFQGWKVGVMPERYRVARSAKADPRQLEIPGL